MTTSYEARARGVGKMMSLVEARRRCPELVVVNGEVRMLCVGGPCFLLPRPHNGASRRTLLDGLCSASRRLDTPTNPHSQQDLTKYRAFSAQIHAVLRRFSPRIEKLGLDEAFLDVTEAVEKEINAAATAVAAAGADAADAAVVGHVYQGRGTRPPCGCGCRQRLSVGSHLAAEMRAALKDEVRDRGEMVCHCNLTLTLQIKINTNLYTHTSIHPSSQLGFATCAGISSNKLLAKMAASLHKPDAQTTLFPVRPAAESESCV